MGRNRTSWTKDNHPPAHLFQKGNPGGPGYPYAGKLEKLRARLFAAVGEAEIDAVAQALLRGAKWGDLGYIKELLDRIFGKSAQSLDVRANVQGGITINIVPAKRPGAAKEGGE